MTTPPKKPKFSWKRPPPEPKGADKKTPPTEAEAPTFEGVARGRLVRSKVPFRVQAQALMYEWCLKATADTSPRAFMTSLGFTASEYTQIVSEIPSSEWYVFRNNLQNDATGVTVKRHVDSIADMNDMHIKAAKLGMAKALEFMTKMKIEERYSRDGVPYYKGFKTSDLLRCMESISHSQKIHRMALGLPTDEGSINIWQQINKSISVGGEQIEETVKELEKVFTYDDIRIMIEANRREKNTVNVTPK